ncbi:facilitated trehalose transporter Tret1-like isoform X1 [Contarinia nasturtii]|uniref:facilitated trehalose transporter Tret1-like isoform X1 n=1 Tax=Contarinia nasturtii TaxID=265458 RepID=UPI0012D39352|nr:facilitated trehalose transporter Tret1-like isoform X1 [Contarinia nasturtii]
MSCDSDSEINSMKNVNYFRRYLSQFVATTVENMLQFDMGLCNFFPFLVIAALDNTGKSKNRHNLDEKLFFSSVQASWMGSIGYVTEPIGSILSALFTDVLGRKTSMMIVNIPIVIGWFMMYNASSVSDIFVANSLLGLGAGLMESPVILYVAEVCEPKFRGIMIAYTHVGWTLGMLFVSVLNTLMPWRMVALICMTLPILTAIALLFVPETPHWLLSKNRVNEAEKSLAWLRGWVPKEAVADELRSLQRYSERYKSCGECIKQNQECYHPPPTLFEKLKELKRKQTLKPFFIVICLFMIALFSGIFAMTPFIVKIFKAYDIPMQEDQAAAYLAGANNLGNVIFLVLIRFIGKRRLYLTMLMIVLLCSAIVSGYGFWILPTGYNSFESPKFSLDNKENGYIPFVCILIWSFCSFCGVNIMPWQMLSEVFPYKTRAISTGLTAALNYVLSFISIKTYYNLETAFSLPGVAFFNCIIIAFGLVLMYNILPETENRTLEEIELHFADNSKKITDRTIAPMCTQQNDYDKNNAEIQLKQISAIKNDELRINYGNGIGNHIFPEKS